MLTINDILRSDFDWDNLKVNDQEREELRNELIIDFLKKNDPKERQLLAMSWNFDGPKEILRWIIDQPDTDKGTILLLYWCMGPGFFKENYADRKECEEKDSWDLEDYDLIDTIEKNYVSGFYKTQVFAFDPANDPYGGGINWTTQYGTEKDLARIPAVMFQALEGEIPENTSWDDGIPDALRDIMDKLYDAL